VGGDSFARSLKATAHGGVVFTIGFVAGTSAAIDLMPIIAKGVTVQGNNTGPVEDLADVARAVAAHRITPIIDKAFGINEAAAAYARLGGGQSFGKVAILH
jgi:NADPH:quinone reductase-like Zn-dependent oxidoreductase